MSIASRINEMTEHLRNDWDGIDKLGLDITEENSNDNLDKNIENIAPVLNRFYNQSSDKTDLSENGIVGRTSQEGTTGKNLLKVFSGGEITVNDITIKSNNNGTFILDGTPSAATYIEIIYAFRNGTNQQSVPKIELDSSKQYTVSINTKTSGIQFSIQKNNESNNINVNSANNSETFTSSNGIYRGYLRIGENITFNNEIIKLQLEEGSTATEYEPYTGGEPSPSPDYPLEIKNLSGDVEYKVRGKNLFVGYNNMQVGFLPTSGNYPTTNSSYPNARYQLIELKQGESVSTSGSTSTFGRIRLINKDTNKVTRTIIDTENDDYISTVNYGSAFQIGTIIAKKDIILGILILSSVFNDNFQIEQGRTATTYEPYISESFPLSLKSRNLFDKDNANVLNGMFINAVAGNIGSNANATSIYIPINPNTTYCVSKTRGNRFAIGYSSTTPAVNVSLTNIVDDRMKTSLTSASASNSKYLVIYISLSATETLQEILDSIMINEGSTVTSYEPYYDIELCNISDYKDRIYSQNGEFYFEKKTGKVVLDGRRNWTKSGNTNIDRFVLSGYVDYGDTNCFSNYFTNETYSDSNYNKSKIFLNTYSNTKRLIINFNTVGTTSLSNFKTWLSTHNTEVQYVLATPTTTKITQENYPTLYSQLLAIQEFLTKYKINKEFLLDYSSPEIEY